MKKKIKCLRCGKCCYYPYLNYWLPCKYLTVDKKGFATCTRYHKRLGSEMGPGAVCVLESEYNIPGCPFNRPGRKPHPYWKMEEK